MNYSFGECLADYGFNFLEKVHEPIFLVNRTGHPVKINEAGRKFLHATSLSESELENFVRKDVISSFEEAGGHFRRIPLGKGCQVIARDFASSDLVMVELVK